VEPAKAATAASQLELELQAEPLWGNEVTPSNLSDGLFLLLVAESSSATESHTSHHLLTFLSCCAVDISLLMCC
jgi:hypothetical protein